jgi:AraC-like DNA-binding protein
LIQISHTRLGRINLRPLVHGDYPETPLRLKTIRQAEVFLGKVGVSEYGSARGPVLICSYKLKPAVDLDHKVELEGMKMLVVIEGRLVLQDCLTEHCVLQEGTLCLFSGDEYRVSLQEQSKVRYLLFAVEPYVRQMNWESFKEGRNHLTAYMQSLIAEIIQPPELPGAPEEFLSDQLLFLLSKVRQASLLNGQEKPGKPYERDLDFVLAADAFIRRHLLQDLTASQIAKAVGVNQTKLQIAFKEHFGTGLGRRQNELRIELAKRQMLETDKSIAEVAMACGYKSPEVFRTNFKYETGMNPAEWRKKNRL